MAIRKRGAYYPANFSLARSMSPQRLSRRRGITVLGLVLLILAVVVAVVLLLRYLPA